MKGVWAILLIAACGAGVASARTVSPLRNPAILNIGFVCQWQDKCMDRQERAMKRAVKYVDKYAVPEWKVAMCNRNASRNRTRFDWKRSRVDWIGFNNCIRNPSLRPPPPPPPRKRTARR